jgi:hypothetical protein
LVLLACSSGKAAETLPVSEIPKHKLKLECPPGGQVITSPAEVQHVDDDLSDVGLDAKRIVQSVHCEVEGRRHGPAIKAQLDEEKTLGVERGEYTNGMKSGTWETLLDDALVSRVQFKDGKRHGSYETWYAPKQLQRLLLDRTVDEIYRNPGTNEAGVPQRDEQGEFAEGLRHGRWKSWSPTGHLRRESNYVAGKRDGAWVEYFENGKKQSAGTFADNRKVGTWSEWNEQGDLVRSEKL